MSTARWTRRAFLGEAARFSAAMQIPGSSGGFFGAPHLQPGSGSAEHPRLHLNAKGWSELREAIAQDALMKRWYDQLQSDAENMLGQPPAAYKLTGTRLLEQSRLALRRISTFAGLYRLDGDSRKADKAKQELLLICSFPDWHPPHFLDVAEMTAAAALGYDWLYGVLSASERQLVRSKIVEFGLQPGMAEFNHGAFWTKDGANNWGQVCCGGLTLGALAIAGPDEAIDTKALLALTTERVRYAMAAYAPDGGWPEGPAYWEYATRYTCLMLSALESATGSDHLLAELPGFAETGDYLIAMAGPQGLLFNYSDADPRPMSSPDMFWLARRFGKPSYAWHEAARITTAHPEIFHLIWAPAHMSELKFSLPPLDKSFSRISVSTMRSSWTDPRAFYLGIKGGDNAVSHSHLDLGSFVLDALGERWALDLGADNYDLPGYFSEAGKRLYRLSTKGHNTLALEDGNQTAQNQGLHAAGPLVHFDTTEGSSSATFDLTSAYAPAFEKVERRATLERSKHPRIVLTDTLRGGKGHNLCWRMHTRAAVKLSGTEAALELHGKRMTMHVESPSSATWTLLRADAPLPEAQQPDVHVLALEMTVPEEGLEVRVTFSA